MDREGKTRVAVIGVGHLGQWHARRFATIDNVSLAAVVDLKAERVDALAGELGCAPLRSLDDLPADVEAVSVATPTREHYSIAARMLEEGRDVLVEKPMVENIEEGRRLIEKAGDRGRILAVGHIERFNPAIRAAAGRLDKPFLIESRRLAPLKERARNVDVVRDLMIHDIDLVCSLVCGGADCRVGVVDAAGAAIVTDKIDVARARLRLHDPAGGHVDAYLLASRLHAGEVREIEFFDASGCLRVNCRDRAACRFVSVDGEMEEKPFDTVEADPLEEELKNFIHAVRNRSEPEVTGNDGLRALALASEIVERINSETNSGT